MNNFILLIFIASVWIWGIRCIFSEGYIFENAGRWLEDKLPIWLFKPLIGCSACMASVHGSLWWWVVGMVIIPVLTPVFAIICWFIFCICLCGLNFMILEAIYNKE